MAQPSRTRLVAMPKAAATMNSASIRPWLYSALLSYHPSPAADYVLVVRIAMVICWKGERGLDMRATTGTVPRGHGGARQSRRLQDTVPGQLPAAQNFATAAQ
jgi:hypothetical protein